MGEYLKAKSGNRIYYKSDKLESPKATVLINHGFAEHLGRYDYLAKELNQSGYNVYRYDLRGHGRSGKRKGHIESYKDFVDDCREMVDLIQANGEEEIFMLGHSMGGLVTFLYGIEYKDTLKGQILSGAAVGKLPSVRGIRPILLKIINVFFSNRMMENPVTDDICSDPQVVEAYREDPLVLKEATVNFYVEFLLNAANYALDHLKEYSYPCLILQGEKDKIVPKEIAKKLHSEISSKDKKIKIYEDLFHEILNEKSKDLIISDIVDWLDSRI